jgi:hypothetical protein
MERVPFRGEVWYMTMFPRHEVRCCDKGTHMSEDDCRLVSGFRKDIDGEMIEELEEKVDPRVGGRGYPDGGQEEGCGGRG